MKLIAIFFTIFLCLKLEGQENLEYFDLQRDIVKTKGKGSNILSREKINSMATCRNWEEIIKPEDLEPNELSIYEVKALKRAYNKKGIPRDPAKDGMYTTWDNTSFLQLLVDKKFIIGENLEGLQDQQRIFRIHFGQYDTSNKDIVACLERNKKDVSTHKNMNTTIIEIICFVYINGDRNIHRSFFNLGDLCPDKCPYPIDVDEPWIDN